MQKYIVGIGEALWDLLPQGKQIGGAPANFAYHVSQFNLPVKVVSAVGHDILGEEILTLLKEKKISAEVVQVNAPTGTVKVTLDAAGIPSYDICTGVAWDQIPFTPKLQSLATQTQVVCFGSLAQRSEISRSTIYRFLDAMPQTSDTLKVFDINLRQHYYNREILQSSLQRCNLLKINDEELTCVSQLFGYEEATQESQCRRLLSEYSLKMVILTCGESGSSVFTPKGTSTLDTPRVQVVDTVGAGDSFTAAFVASLLQGKSVPAAHRVAVDVSAYVCTCAGAMPPFIIK